MLGSKSTTLAIAKGHKWLPRCLGLLVFSWYAIAASPGFFWLDSAELSASSAGLGSAHPTGFPLYILLGKLASFLPIGELSFRINLLSACCAALAVSGATRLILKLGRDDWSTLFAAAGGGTTLAFSFLFARQATVAEVYAPTAALLVLTLHLFDSVVRGANAKTGLSLAWVAGLGLALHPSFRILIGLPILALFTIRLYRGARWPLLAPVMTSLSALALHLYLPLRSATGRISLLDWGHPNTLSKTMSHANASEIRQVYADTMMSSSSEIVLHNASTFLQQVSDSVGLLCLLAAAAGAIALTIERKTRWMGVTLVFILAIDSLYGLWINPMGLIDFQNGVPTVLVLCIFAGTAVATFARSMSMAAPFVSAVLSFAILIPAALVTIPALGRGSDLPRTISESAILSAKPGAVLFVQGDSLAAASLFLATSEGTRPDLATFVLSMLSDKESVAAMWRKSSVDKNRVSMSENTIEAALGSGRNVYWENGKRSPPGPIVLGPVVSELVSRDKRSVDPLRAASELTALYSQDDIQSHIARRSLAHSLTNLGRVALSQRNLPAARWLFENAIAVRGTHSEARVNLGVILSREGKLREAAAITERALEDEPNRVQSLLNAARYRMAIGDLVDAEKHASRALRVAPTNSGAWEIAGLIAFKDNAFSLAEKRLLRALVLSPKSKVARGALFQVQAILKSKQK